jgi:vitamin K-dependent gamma-carboxylase
MGNKVMIQTRSISRTNKIQTAHSVIPWPHLFAPIDGASLALFRMGFGAIMLWEVWRYFTYGWISEYYMQPTFTFTYYGFDWVKPWPGVGMYIHFTALGILALCILLGLFYRINAILFFLGFSYVFLLDQARYLNHFYLVALVSFLLIFVPAHRTWSLDSWRKADKCSDTVPRWSLWLLRTQIGIVYFFGGIAKLNGDWLRGEPMRMWLAARTDFPLIGHWFTEEWMVYLFSYGGLLFDLLFVPLVLWRRTRWLALVIGLVFHLTNARLFHIGIFPWFMLAASLLFLDPSWPRLRWWRGTTATSSPDASPSKSRSLSQRQGFTLALIGLYLGWQVLVPLRHFLYPGDVSWTEEGHRFSWHMKLRSKDGDAEFVATDVQTRTNWSIDPLHYINAEQFEEMVANPDMILQFAHHVAEQHRLMGEGEIEVYGWVQASLNGRPAQLLINPEVNLAEQPRVLTASDWILPLSDSS